MSGAVHAVGVGTVITCSHAAFARVLTASLGEHLPAAAVTICVADGDVLEPPAIAGARVVTPLGLGLDRDELERMAAIYGPAELACALKPALLRRLVDEADVGVYLDADVQVFGSLDALVDAAARAGLVLVPHAISPPPDDGLVPDERGFLASGIYNGGVLAATGGAATFLRWWAERCARHARNRPADGEVFDQRWLTVAAGYFPHAVLRDPAYDVAYWNVPPRRLEAAAGAFRVDGAPLQAFHFSGFDPRRPFELSRYDGAAPRVLPDEQPALAALCEAYASALRAVGYDDAQRVGYGYGTLADGSPIDGVMRALYRDALLPAERARASLPPNPFADADGFIRWLTAPDDLGRGRRSLNRWAVRRVSEDRALAERYGDLRSTAAAYRDELARTAGVPGWLVPPPVTEASLPVRAIGANVGVRQAASGLETTLRTSLDAALSAAGESVVSISDDVAVERAPVPFPAAVAVYDVTVFCLPVEALLAWNHVVGDEFHAGRRHAIYTAWPGDRPPALGDVARFLDEIWLPAASLAAVTEVERTPVHVVPAVVTPPPPTDRAALRLPDGFLVVAGADDPDDALHAVTAFARAFAPGSGATLAIAQDGLGRRPLAALRAACAERSDVVVVPEPLSRLLGSADAYLALPSSAAVGLECLVALAAGVPTIASDHVRAVAPYRVARVPVLGDGSPDLDAVVAALEACRARGPQERARLAEQARAVCAAHGVERAATALAARLAALRVNVEQRPGRWLRRAGRTAG